MLEIGSQGLAVPGIRMASSTLGRIAVPAGLILNRYIPHVSPLMNRLEFIGNALFIPYFLIGVGMLININLLFQGSQIGRASCRERV